LVELHLRGDLVQLGTARDVLSDRANTNHITIELGVDNKRIELVADAPGESDVLPILTQADPDSVLGTGLLQNQFQFLQADRLTPKTHYDLADATSRDLGFLGSHGEYTPDFLGNHGDRHQVELKRRCPQLVAGLSADLLARVVGTPKLYDQIGGWLQHISPGVRLRSDRVSQTDLVSLRFSYASTEIAQDSGERRPSHVGFGLTYCLPIVTAALAAPRDALLLLENPEAHLHPRGQAALGTLLAKCASDGVQIVLETHSDHLLNGIRLAVKHRELDSNEVRLCNFTREPATGDSYVESPTLLGTGELTAWPSGFFDEWEKSLEELLR
jgi:predicted ATPase